MSKHVKLGKRPARLDLRIPRMSKHFSGLPPPKDNINWYARLASWGMLANDTTSDCAIAGPFHSIMQMTAYATDRIIVPTDAEAIAAYSAVGGYVPGDPTTDQGLYLSGGPGSVINHWIKTGFVCGGHLNKAHAVMRIERLQNTVEWRQGLSHFAGLITGLRLPENIVATDVTPFIWNDVSGPTAGGHCVYIVGVELVAGQYFYDLISWGQRFRATQTFLESTADEMYVIVNPAFFNAAGMNPMKEAVAGLMADMALLRGE